jgi:hypothetical protein
MLSLVAVGWLSVVAAAPVMMTPLIKAGKLAEAKAASAIQYNGVDYGYAAHYTVAAQHTARDNHM